MVSQIRIPGLVDILRLSGPEDIRAAAVHTALDRDFGADSAPLLNRLILRRAAQALRIGQVPLPSAAMRDDPDRQAAQQALSIVLGADAAAWDSDALDDLADFVRDRTRKPLGLLAQQAIGRLFAGDYRATRSSWRSAELLDAAVRSFNPLRRFVWAMTGAVEAAQLDLGRQVANDPAGIHATGIAVHSFARSVERLRQVLANDSLRGRLSTRAALGRAVTAPERLMRVASTDGDLAGHRLRAGTVVILETRTLAEASCDRRSGFMSDSWSHCPAQGSAPAALAEIWARATGERLGTAGEKR